MRKEKSCGAIIFRKYQDKYQYVLVKQKFGLHFGFPKGHVEKNESEIMTAVREVKEETGLDVEIFDQFKGQTQYSPRPGVIKNVVYFLAKAKTYVLNRQEEEIAEAIWVDETDVVDMLSFKSDEHVFKSLKDHIKFGN